MKVAIVTDSLTNLTSVDLERYPDVYYGYLNVIVDGKAYAEQKEIDNDRLFRMIDEGANYSTSQPAPEEFVQLYTDLIKKYDYILGLFCTNNVSGTVNSARIASTMIDGAENRITVIDTNTASIGVENVLIRVCQLLEEGKSIDEVIKVVDFYKTRGPMYLYVDDLNTLVRTGRLSKTAASIGNLLNIKPIIGLSDGKLDVFDKVRTKKRVFKWIVERLRADVEKSGKQIVRITHVNAIEGANELKALMEEACKELVEVHVGNEIGPVMAIHFGRGGVGACWMPEQYNI
ncbi:DegV family protein [Turicibacter sp. TJ11]|uniref:DegV family protein n=1 Tax=Turicibacter sp. TJ11 TaxID=2806443 RepID=UPI001F33AC7F|nr:DegV family protein [Turicibacter sp. TJ11]